MEETLMNLTLINKCCIAYFINVLNHLDVDLYLMRPTCPPHLEMVGNYLPDEEINYPFYRDFFCGRIIIHLEEKPLSILLKEMHLEDFIEKYCLKQIEESAEKFAEVIKKYPLCDVIFSSIPDNQPCPAVKYKDEETWVDLRAAYGLSLASNTYSILLDYQVLIVDRVRKIENETVTLCCPVKNMTLEQQKKYDIQPESF